MFFYIPRTPWHLMMWLLLLAQYWIQLLSILRILIQPRTITPSITNDINMVGILVRQFQLDLLFMYQWLEINCVLGVMCRWANDMYIKKFSKDVYMLVSVTTKQNRSAPFIKGCDCQGPMGGALPLKVKYIKNKTQQNQWKCQYIS